MKRQVVLGTHNPNKIREIHAILNGLALEILTMNDFPKIAEVEETGKTFAENALLKAREVYRQSGILTLSDDSGLEVDALNGAPGIYSARYAGEAKDYAANNRKLLEELQDVPEHQREAQFRCVVAIAGPEVEQVVEGIVRGMIIYEPRGRHGFGYDPLFVPEGFSQTFSEMGDELKNQISHRSQAFRKAREVLEKIFSS
jgi:XTP/dITP diphosphohydrolase